MINPQRRPSEGNGKPPAQSLRRSVSTMVDKKLSRFDILKRVVRDGLQTAFEVGAALLEIREGKLYRTEFDSFEAFCESEFKIVRSRAYQLIEAAQVKASLPPEVSKILDTERHARALAKVPEEKRVEVLTEAAKAPGPVTAKRITEAAKSNGHAAKVETPNPAQCLDKTGYTIPETILEDWDRADETSRRMLNAVSSLRSELKKAKDDNDPIFSEVTNSTIADLNNAYGSLKCVVPYGVCTSCQGRAQKKCSLCRGRGFVSEFAWRSYVPAEAKAIREKASQKK